MGRAISLAPLALALSACAVCLDGPLNAADLCQPNAWLDAGQPSPGACWRGDPADPDPSTHAATAHPGTPHPVLCSLAREYTHSPACVESPGGTERDEVDNDCDGLIDEDQFGNGGRPTPPPVPKSSAFVLPPGHQWTVEATGAGCGRDDCAQRVAEMALRCVDVPRFEGTAAVLPRRDDTCLLAEPGVCGTAAAQAHFSGQLVRCNSTVRHAVIGWDGRNLSLTGFETTEHRDPPRVDAGPYITDVDALLRCVADAAVEVNTFGDGTDTDRDGRHDRCDVCPEEADPEQRDADGDGLGDACDCVVPEERDERRCWVEGDETRPPSIYGLPGLLECAEGEVEPACATQPAWPTIQAWFDAEIDADWDDPAVQAAAAAEAEVTVVWLDVPEAPLPNAAVNRQRVQAGRDFERYVQKGLQAKWGFRFRRRYSFNPPPLDVGMQYFATVDLNGLIDAIPVDRPGPAPARVTRRDRRTRWSDGFIQDHRRTHDRGVVIEAKCLNPFLRFDPRRQSWAWLMQIGFAAQLHDYINHAKATWGRGAVGTPPIKVQYFFCDFTPRWVDLLMALALADGAASGLFGIPNTTFGPPHLRETWVRSPVWYPDALGLADAVGTAIENWEGFVPWGNEPGNVLMNVTGSLYDQLSGSE